MTSTTVSPIDDDDGAVGLAGDLAGFQRDLMLAEGE